MRDAPDPLPFDLGGAEAYRGVSLTRDESLPDAFGRRVEGLRLALARKELLNAEELRRGVEELPGEEYRTLGYHERWLRSIAATLVRRGVLAPGEAR
jgi:hypothetical protein